MMLSPYLKPSNVPAVRPEIPYRFGPVSTALDDHLAFGVGDQVAGLTFVEGFLAGFSITFCIGGQGQKADDCG